MSESYERGIHRGWGAANYAEAYGTTEGRDAEASRRAEGDTDFEAGFIEGWDLFEAGQWQDGSSRFCEDCED